MIDDYRILVQHSVHYTTTRVSKEVNYVALFHHRNTRYRFTPQLSQGLGKNKAIWLHTPGKLLLRDNTALLFYLLDKNWPNLMQGNTPVYQWVKVSYFTVPYPTWLYQKKCHGFQKMRLWERYCNNLHGDVHSCQSVSKCLITPICMGRTLLLWDYFAPCVTACMATPLGLSLSYICTYGRMSSFSIKKSRSGSDFMGCQSVST